MLLICYQFNHNQIFLISNKKKILYSTVSIKNDADKLITLILFVLNFSVSLSLLIFFNLSGNYFQYVVESLRIYEYDFYLGIDGISIYFVLLTTFIMPLTLLSN